MMSTRLTQAIPFFETRDLLAEKNSWFQLLKQCVLGCGTVAAVTFVAYTLRFPLSTAGFLYLFLVMVFALFYGVWQATFVSLIAVSCLNFFFVPPTWSFTVSDSRDWIALISEITL